jgi:single-strand DNA-binding protein
MTTLNKAMILGRLGRDPEVRYTSGGAAVANISIATNSRSKDKSGEWQDVTEWHRVVLFSKNAEIAEKYLKKGGAVYVEGRIQTKSWEDQQSGQKRYSTEIIADQLKMMGGRDNQPSNDIEEKLESNSESRSTVNDIKKTNSPNDTKAQGFEDLDDDIPF